MHEYKYTEQNTKIPFAFQLQQDPLRHATLSSAQQSPSQASSPESFLSKKIIQASSPECFLSKMIIHSRSTESLNDQIHFQASSLESYMSKMIFQAGSPEFCLARLLLKQALLKVLF